MAVGKAGKRGKGSKRKAVDPMSRKEWYDVVAPAVFSKRHFTKTLVNRTVGQKRSEDNLKGRIFEANLADLTGEETGGYRKIQLRVDHVQGRNCVTNFHGMSLTKDKLASLIKKWCSLVEARAVVTTTDNHTLAIDLIGFTAREAKQESKNCYAQSSQLRAIRKRMVDEVTSFVKKLDLKQAVKKFVAELPASGLPKACRDIFPLRDREVYIRKVKILKMPKFDLARLMDTHENKIPDSVEEVGVTVHHNSGKSSL